MQSANNTFTFKLLLSYLVLGAFTALVSYILYSEFKVLTKEDNIQKEEKLIVTGNLVNLVYETDGLSRLALLSLKEEDFRIFSKNIDSLQNIILDLKLIANERLQQTQLDSICQLLHKKLENTTEFRSLKINKSDSALDNILLEIQELEKSMGKMSIEMFVKNPEKLNFKKAALYQDYIEYVNKKNNKTKISKSVVDSMLIESRLIVKRAKRSNDAAAKIMKNKENELIENDLAISNKIRSIITTLDAEISKNNSKIRNKKKQTVSKTQDIFRYAGLIALGLIVLFSYFILTDFFKAERFKKSLEESKKYAENLLQSREQLITTVSHDVRSPLNTIMGYTELTSQTQLTAQQQNYISQINTSAEYVTHLVNDLLDLSKIDAGKLKVEQKPFSLSELVIQTANAIEKNYSEKELDLKIIIDDSIKMNLYVSDPLRLKQIINNLIGNAFKFTERGGITISVNHIKNNPETDDIYISIKDTGIGISMDQQKDIFEEFTQADQASAHHGGYGLGLTISKKLTEILGGTLELESDLGTGSTFTVKLALTKSDIKLKKTLSTQYILSKNPTVLILDDDDTMLHLLEEVFSSIHIKPITFTGISELKKYKNVSFDFILTDIQMPGTNGLQLIDLLKSGNFSNYNKQPVFGMTGSYEYTEDYYISKGFSGMFFKPFTKDKLIKTLSSFFDTNINTTPQKNKMSTSKTYDLSYIKNFIDDDKAILDILKIFTKNTKKDVKTLKSSIEKKKINIKQIKKTSHKMLTMFRQLKVEKAVIILEKLEILEENDTKKATTYVTKLLSEVNNLLKELAANHNL